MSSSSDETPCKNHSMFENPDDRISNLPDDIIGELLSRLRTKDALRTSVLSRTWKYKWKSTYNVNIDDFGVASYDMSRIIVSTLSCRIKKFRLYCQRLHDPRTLETWISWVFNRNLESVNINVYYLTERLDSKRCFSKWASLTELELYLSCTLVHPANSCFPNLKKLLLAHGCYGNIKIKVEQISSKGGIIVNFPVLEVLVLKGCEWMDVKFVEIHAPKLIMFEIMLSSSNNKFYLHTPLVSCLEFSDTVPKKIILPREYRDILKQLPGIKTLRLSKLAVQDLLPSWPEPVFPTFDRLKELQVCEGYCIRNVLELLQLLPTLELLKLNISDWYSNHGIGQPWPRKIFSNLKKVELYNFNGSNLQMNFTKLVLKNASKLKQMSVYIWYGMTVKKANNMLSKLKPKSSSCQLVVSERFEFH